MSRLYDRASTKALRALWTIYSDPSHPWHLNHRIDALVQLARLTLPRRQHLSGSVEIGCETLPEMYRALERRGPPEPGTLGWAVDGFNRAATIEEKRRWVWEHARIEHELREPGHDFTGGGVFGGYSISVELLRKLDFLERTAANGFHCQGGTTQGPLRGTPQT